MSGTSRRRQACEMDYALDIASWLGEPFRWLRMQQLLSSVQNYDLSSRMTFTQRLTYGGKLTVVSKLILWPLHDSCHKADADPPFLVRVTGGETPLKVVARSTLVGL